MENVPMDKYRYNHTCIQLPRLARPELRNHHTLADNTAEARVVPSDMEELLISGQNARACSRHKRNQRQISGAGKRAETPAENYGALQPRRGEPDERMSAAVAADAYPHRNVLVLPVVHRIARRTVPLG